MSLIAVQTQKEKRLINWKLQDNKNIQTETERKKNGKYRREYIWYMGQVKKA